MSDIYSVVPCRVVSCRLAPPVPSRPVSDLEGAVLAQHHGAEDVAQQQQPQEVVAEELDVCGVCRGDRRQSTAPPSGMAAHPTSAGNVNIVISLAKL